MTSLTICPYCVGDDECEVCHGIRQIERTVYFAVGDVTNPAPDQPPFIIVRVDVSNRSGNGVEGIVESMHWSREVADETADRLNRAFGQEVHHV